MGGAVEAVVRRAETVPGQMFGVVEAAGLVLVLQQSPGTPETTSSVSDSRNSTTAAPCS